MPVDPTGQASNLHCVFRSILNPMHRHIDINTNYRHTDTMHRHMDINTILRHIDTMHRHIDINSNTTY